MYYLIFSASYHAEDCLREEFGETITLDSLGISQKLKELVLQWNSAYEEIIPLSPAERENMENKIKQLDNEGQKLVAHLRNEANQFCKIKYYSEGLLKYLY